MLCVLFILRTHGRIRAWEDICRENVRPFTPFKTVAEFSRGKFRYSCKERSSTDVGALKWTYLIMQFHISYDI